MRYRSGQGQDRFLDRQVFGRKRGGVFVEVGALDGVEGSNSWFFEKHRGWTGMCVEPQQDAFRELAANRSCACIEAAVSTEEGEADFVRSRGRPSQLSSLASAVDPGHRAWMEEVMHDLGHTPETVRVRTVPLADLLRAHGMREVDLCSIDTEGSELDVLRSIDFGAVFIRCILVENHEGAGPLREFLHEQGYERVRHIHYDDVFVHNLVQAARVKRIRAAGAYAESAARRLAVGAVAGTALSLALLALGAANWAWIAAGCLGALSALGWLAGAGYLAGIQDGHDLAASEPVRQKTAWRYSPPPAGLSEEDHAG